MISGVWSDHLLGLESRRPRRRPVWRCAPARLALLASLATAGCGAGEVAAVAAENRVGDRVCVACHVEQAGFAATAHRLTSAHPTEATVLGSFAEDENVLHTVNPLLHYRMEARESGYYQTAVIQRGSEVATMSERIDLVTGSGRKGQTYLYWKADRLFQLPVSYWTELDSWIVSPGYGEHAAQFDRPTSPRCLECHATYFDARPGSGVPNRYDTTSYVPGITCEKCHGGGREHVARQSSWVGRLRGPAIVNPARLDRGRQIDGCALCHGGIGEPVRPPFTYPPGAPLTDYLLRPGAWPAAPVDVHGNQVALLERSPCYQGSATLTCSSCHDVHQTQRDLAAFAPTCLSCHQLQSCGVFPEQGEAIADRCVGCHMPELPARSIVARHRGEPVRPEVRTHRIGVYPAAPDP